MNYKHIVVPKPFVREFSLLANQNDFYKEILNQKRVEVDISYLTKTSLHISLCINGKFSFQLAFNNPKFKFLIREELNYFTGTKPIKHHFKITKHQGYLELKQYVEDCLNSILKEYDGEITVEWIQTKAFNEIYLKHAQQN